MLSSFRNDLHVLNRYYFQSFNTSPMKLKEKWHNEFLACINMIVKPPAYNAALQYISISNLGVLYQI